jgi:DHA1 family bicyclomycin/chloramphenicol resistance-like MFS transporter
MLVMGLAPILAPLVGGQLLVIAGWRAIFWTLAGFGVACFLAVLFWLGETLPPERRAVGGIGSALVAYARLLANRRFLAFALTGSLAMSGLFAYITGSPLVFMQIHGVSPQAYGLLFGLNALGIVGGAQVNVRLLRYFTARAILRVGVLVELAAGLVLVAVAASGAGGLVAIMIPLFIVIASLGFVVGNTVAAAMAAIDADRGAASALIGVIQFGLAALVSGLLGALQDQTALPMALVIAGGAAAAVVFSRLAGRAKLHPR